ncbi:MAG: ABC transporter permease, partial [Chromatiales bacterium]|nr:ABC transporter permease [Chromatiales bacterium]
MENLVILSTDFLIFLLVVLIAIFAVYASKKEHLRAPWRHVVRSRVGVATMVILSFYVVIGLLDSVHFHPELPAEEQTEKVRYSTEIISLFDQLVGPLRTEHERTYSAPLSAYLYSKESMELADGTTVRDFPRLKYGGAHLTNPEQEWLPDIWRRSVLGALKGVVVSVVAINIVLMFIGFARGKHFGRVAKEVLLGQPEIPWRVLLGTLTVMLVLLFWTMELASAYHLFGTDKVGEDVFYQALKSIRTGLLIGTLTTLV